MSINGMFFVSKLRSKSYVTCIDALQAAYGKYVGAIVYLPSCIGDICWTAAVLSALGTTLAVILDMKGNYKIRKIVSNVHNPNLTSPQWISNVTNVNFFRKCCPLCLCECHHFNCIHICWWNVCCGVHRRTSTCPYIHWIILDDTIHDHI